MPKEDAIVRARKTTEALLAIGALDRQGSRLTAAWFDELGIEGVTPAQANALVVIFEARGPTTAKAVAERLSVSEVTVGRFIAALEREGWIDRVRSDTDRRAWLLVPTPKAYDTLPRFIEVSNRIIDTAFAGIPQRNVDSFIRTLGRVSENLQAADATAAEET